MLNLDLKLIENGKRFQSLCYRIAEKEEFSNCIPTAIGSWDKGMDILEYDVNEYKVVWQCKFTTDNISKTKPTIKASLDSLDSKQIIQTWILCISQEATGAFIDWISREIKKYPFIKSFKIWDKTILLKKLEKYPDIVEVFFYRTYKELEKYFTTEELELINIKIGKNNWMEADPGVLQWVRKNNDITDLIIDIIIKNRGSSEAMLSKASVRIYDVKYLVCGIPGSGLLIPQHTYEISIQGGQKGIYNRRLEPPLLIKPKMHERFKLKIKNIGYAWVGKAAISFQYGKDKILRLPTILMKV